MPPYLKLTKIDDSNNNNNNNTCIIIFPTFLWVLPSLPLPCLSTITIHTKVDVAMVYVCVYLIVKGA